MKRHLVTAHLIVYASSWKEAERTVQKVCDLPGVDEYVSVQAVKWEETLEDEDEEPD